MILVFRVKETGQWCAPSIEDAAFHMTDAELAAYADRVATTLRLPSGALVPEIAESDPRTGALLAESDA